MLIQIVQYLLECLPEFRNCFKKEKKYRPSENNNWLMTAGSLLLSPSAQPLVCSALMLCPVSVVLPAAGQRALGTAPAPGAGMPATSLWQVSAG